jgi:hypothetical protein
VKAEDGKETEKDPETLAADTKIAEDKKAELRRLENRVAMTTEEVRRRTSPFGEPG